MRKMNVVCIWQGLGNQMFQYAFAKSLEIHTGRKVYIDAGSLRRKELGEEFGSDTVRAYGLDHFNISLRQVPTWYRCMWNYTRGDKWYYEMIKFLLEVGRYPYKYYSQKDMPDFSVPEPSLTKVAENTYLKGWFQSETYFSDIRDILLKEFTPVKEIVFPQELTKTIEEKESVSVHIRRGDFKRINMVLDKKYYDTAMDIVFRKVRNPVWIVFSDDISYVKQNFEWKGETVFIDETYRLRDFEQLMLMSKCKHNIIANSTFSWWGAWLNQNESKIVAAPTRWFQGQKNIVPTGWIQI